MRLTYYSEAWIEGSACFNCHHGTVKKIRLIECCIVVICVLSCAYRNNRIMSNLENEPTVAVSLTVKDASAALEFYTRAFGAEVQLKLDAPDGSVAHAEFKIGNSKIYISGESEEWNAYAMADGVMASSLLAIATDDCDRSYQKAVEAGGEGLSEPKNQFWGARVAIIKDPFGYRWSFRELVEEVSPEEMAKSVQKLFKID